MLMQEQLKVIANFLLDGAKIIFGSLVIGVFVPSATGSVPWFTFLFGVLSTAVSLGAAVYLVKTVKEKT